MSASELITKALNSGVYLYVEGDALKFKAKDGQPSAELLADIKRHKVEIIALLKKLDSQDAIEEQKVPDIIAYPCDGEEVVSFAQQRLWFIDQMGEGGSQYNMPGAFELEGTLNAEALSQALHEIIRRHEVLRTNLLKENGEVKLLTRDSFELPLSQVDLSDKDETAQQQEIMALGRAEANELFDIEQDVFLRAILVKLNDTKHVVLFTMHHIASDGWSGAVLVKEFAELYRSYSSGEKHSLPELKIQYRDYARWQKDWLQGEAIEESMGYWTKQLADLPQVHSIPLDKPRPQHQTFNGDYHRHLVPQQLSSQINGLCQQQGVTLFMFLQSALSILLSRYSGEQDIVIGSPIAGRLHNDIEPLIGFFVNTLVIRSQVNGEQTYNQYLQSVRNTILDAYNHQKIPFEMLVEELNPERNLAHSPVVQVMLSLQNNEQVALELPGLSLKTLEAETDNIKFDLELIVSESDAGIAVNWRYNSDLFSESSIARMASNFTVLLQDLVTEPQKQVSQMTMLTDAETQQIAQWNETAQAYPDQTTISGIFEQQALKTPEHIAVSDEQNSLTYEQLNRQSNQLARYLRNQGIDAGSFVGLCLERSVNMLVSILGVMKAGAAYVPVDPEYPQNRMSNIIAQADMKVIITEQGLLEVLPEVEAHVLTIDTATDQQTLSGLDGANLSSDEATTGPAQLAYAMFTSGSTGQPKGVLIEHCAIVNRLDWMQKQYPLADDDKVLQKTPYSFDVSVWELLWPVMVGAEVVFAKPEGHKSPDYLVDVITSKSITCLHFVPSMLQVMLDTTDWSVCQSVRNVFCSGEALPLPLKDAFFAAGSGAKLHNLYGPTEAAIDVSYWDCADETPCHSVPIGKPISNIQLYVLDADNNQQPVGAPGELHIGGVGVARGYLNLPEQTATSFVANPFVADDSKMYKTGDLVRRHADGNLEFLGRIDNQVKIRGFRIELGEIEYQLASLDAVKECAVIARKDRHGGSELAAYVVADSNVALTGDDVDHKAQKAFTEELQEQLKAALPEYMVPSLFLFLDAMPLTSNGKLDRKSLPQPDESDLSKSAYVAPNTEMETVLCDIWQEVLSLEKVGIDDNFFSLGGHSLLAVKLSSRIQDELQQNLPLKQLFETPTIEGVAKYLEAHVGDEQTELVPRIEPDFENLHLPFPQTGVQQAYVLGRSDAFALGNVAAHKYTEYNVAELDIPRLTEVWNIMIKRHGILRAVFTEDGTQRILQDVPRYEFEYLDVRNDAKEVADDKLMAIRDELSHQVFKVDQWPLYEMRISRLGDEHYRLHISMDLLLLDGSSSRLLEKEFRTLYEGVKNELSPLELSFRDYVVAEHGMRKTTLFENAKDYWMKRLDTLPMAPALPLAMEPGDIKEPKFGRYQFKLEPARWRKMKTLINDLGVTPTVFMLTIYSQVLNQWTKNNKFTLNLTLFNRIPFHDQVEELAGDFTSLTLLEIEALSNQSLEENAKRIQGQLWDDLEHRYFGGTEVLRALNRQSGSHEAISMPMVFTSALALTNDGLAAEGKDSENERTKLEAEDFGSTQTSQVWLDHQVSQRRGGLVITWDVILELLPEGMWGLIFDAYVGLIEGFLEGRVSWQDHYRPALPSDQVEGRLAYNRTEVARTAETLHGGFLAQVAEHGARDAVRSGDTVLSYAEVDRLAGDLSARLHAGGAKKDHLIAIVMEKGWEQIVASLGINYAGGAYLPIDGGLPQERIEQLLSLGEVTQVVTQAHLYESIAWPEGLEVLVPTPDVAQAQRYMAEVEVTDLAYVIFTSGSTGTPKGVMIDHRGASNTIADINGKFQVTAEDKVLGLSALNFDLSVYDIFGLLSAGGCVVLPEAGKEKDPSHWVELVERHSITLWNTVPALAQLYVEQLQLEGNVCGGESLRVYLLSGDWIPLRLPEQLTSASPQSKVISLGGATEASIWSIYYPIDSVCGEWKSIPYGMPLENQQFHVLKSDFSVCPDWVTGDLYIGGIGVALGYWGDEEKTRSSFVTHPQTGERLYKTGDLGRYVPEGHIEFLGREDTQVKVHGHRIELGEIESVLARHEMINDAVVLAVGESRHNKTLVAYIQPLASDADDQSLAGESAQPLLKGTERTLFKLEQKGLRSVEDSASLTSLGGAPSLSESLTLMPSVTAEDVALTGMSQAQLGSWLSCLGVMDAEGHVIGKRYYPSAGSLYPVQTYVAIGAEGVAGLSQGLYYYAPQAHGLVHLTDDVQTLPASMQGSPLGILQVADYDAIAPLYGERTERFCLLESGHMSQLLLDSAAVHEVAIREIDTVASDDVRSALSLGDNHHVVQSFVAGGVAVGSVKGEAKTVSGLSRQSYREYLPEAVESGALMRVLSVLDNAGEGVNVYVRCGDQSVTDTAQGLYRYDVSTQQLVALDSDIELDRDEAVNAPIYSGSAFSVYLTGRAGVVSDVTLVGGLGQRLMHESVTEGLGLCPIGSLAFTPESDEEVLLYSFEGGAVSAQQMQEWPTEESGQKQDIEGALREYLLSQLPNYMVPSAYMVMAQFPLTANGKVNRKALPMPEAGVLDSRSYVAPRNATEQVLCDIWQEVLGVEQVGIHDNFFEIGGNSLLAIKVMNLVRDRLSDSDAELSLGFLFRHPVPAKLTEALDEQAHLSALQKVETETAGLEDSELEMGEL